MTDRQVLAGYVALQRVLARHGALQRERATPPPELVELQQRLTARRAELAGRSQRAAELAREQAQLTREAELLREEREHFRKQKTMVTNMRQLQAVVSELDNVGTQLKAKEDRLLEVWQELEALNAAIAGLSSESDEERAGRERGEAAWAQRRETLELEIAEVERRVREIKSEIGAAAVAEFKKLWDAKKPLAVVPTDGAACSACHAELRPSLLQLVRSGEGLQHCDSCHRLLYDPEQFPA